MESAAINTKTGRLLVDGGAPFLILAVELEDCCERFGRHGDGPKLTHLLFAFLLFFKQLLFARDIAAVTFGEHVLAHGAHRFARDHLAADRGLDGHLKQLARDIVAQVFADAPCARIRLVGVRDERQRIDNLAV